MNTLEINAQHSHSRIAMGSMECGTLVTSPYLLSSTSPNKKSNETATVMGAFVYPPTKEVEKTGYYSWPGSSFDPEGRQAQYCNEIKNIDRKLGMIISMNPVPLDEDESVTRFINEVKQNKPDGLLLIPFKKWHWEKVTRIVEETDIPTVILATLGVLLIPHIRQMHQKPGVYMISSQDNMNAVEYGMKMIQTACRLKESRLVNIAGSEVKDQTVPHLGTHIRTVPTQRFVDIFQKIGVTDNVRNLAAEYINTARRILEPTREDITEAAKTYFVLKQIVEEEKGDAVMMHCLSGLRHPRQHVPPCMGFMSLRDEGIPVGCQSDLNSTLTMMMVQQLFDKPGFQQNAAMDTAKNLYFGAHCTCASKMNGVGTTPEPLILRSHAEAGWGCVPRVLLKEGQEVTMALYLSGEKPQLLLYSGEIVCCPDIPPTGGCRTNVQMTINEVDDVCDVKGMHQIIFYGNHVKQFKQFAQLCNIEVVV